MTPTAEERKVSFPIIRGRWLRAVPFSFVEESRKRAEQNHGQTLERLRERGGLDADELLTALEDRPLNFGTRDEAAETKLITLLAGFSVRAAEVAAVERERKRCADIARAIDSGRGNETEIATAIEAGN